MGVTDAALRTAHVTGRSDDDIATSTTAADLLARVWAAPPRAGRTRIVGVDGFSGAGKTTLARAVRALDGDVSLLSLETLYLGWDGLAAGPGRAREQVVDPLVRGATPRVEPWDWRHDRVAPPRPKPVGPVLLLEGCGAGARVLRDAYALLVWVDAGAAERDERLRARDDWADYSPHRASFERQERALAAAEGSRAAADVVVTVRSDGWTLVRDGPG